VLAPDRHGTGTNALLLRCDPAADGPAFRFHFGPDSYARHVDEAHRLGLDVVTAITAGTALDLDTPEDLDRVLSAECRVPRSDDLLFQPCAGGTSV
jgi:2-phospho-L-lactate guanylyltransferase